MSRTTRTRGAAGGIARPRGALTVVLVVAAVLSGWNLAGVGYAPYYAAGAVSMSRGLRALLFGTVDPGATLTLDKLSGFLLPQALSVAVFGVHGWSLAAPQVVEGVVTVWGGYRIGLRWRGRAHGLVLAGLLTLTPVLVATDGRPTEDAMVTMCCTLAFAAVLAAVEEQRPGLMVLAGMWIGFGFQAKMLAAWLVVPAIAVVALLHRSPHRRPWFVGSASAFLVAAAVSLAWPAAVAAVPEAVRPFVDGTSDDNPFSMVFGYNGLDRLLPRAIPGALPQLHGAGPLVNATRTGTAGDSPAKLLLPQLTTQIGWLYPAAATGAAVSLAAAGRQLARRRPLRTEDAVSLGLAAWLVVAGSALSVAFMPHASYLALIAPPVAAFATRGLIRAIEAYRRDAPTGARVALPILVVVQTAWACSIIATSAPQVRFLVGVIAVAGGVTVVVLLRVRRGGPPTTRGPLVVALAGMLLPTGIWAAFPLAAGGGGSASDPYAGPPVGVRAGRALLGIGDDESLLRLGVPLAGVRSGPPAVGAADAGLIRLVRADGPRADAIPFASDSLPLVEHIVLATRLSPLPMGGYSGRAPFPSQPGLRALVRDGRLRWIVLRAGRRSSAPGDDQVWVRERCRFVESGRWVVDSTSVQTLWDCSGARHD